jgi:hypothetical protein
MWLSGLQDQLVTTNLNTLLTALSLIKQLIRVLANDTDVRLYPVCTPAGSSIIWALADPKLDGRQVLMPVLDHDPALASGRLGPCALWPRDTTQASTHPRTPVFVAFFHMYGTRVGALKYRTGIEQILS